MSDDRPVLAVLGGSFNPPHLGHALLPGYLLAAGLADRVLVAPCADHPLGKSLTPFVRRMSWARLAFAEYLHGDSRVELSEIEAELAGARDGRPSYTLELLEAVAERYPDMRVRLAMGSDIVRSGETERWHRWDTITEKFPPIVIPRAGWSAPGEAALPEVSSTVVRSQIERIREGGEGAQAGRELLAKMVPAAVADALLRWIDGDEPRIWVFGHGHVAHHAVPWLRDCGFMVEQRGARAAVEGSEDLPSVDPPPIGVWLLARDGALHDLAEGLAGRLPAGVPVLHAAGARRAREVLAPLANAGHPVGTLHPICSLRRERSVSRLARSGWGVGGDPGAWALGQRLVGARERTLDLRPLDARGRLAYHGACALVANHQAVLQDRAAAALREEGLDADGSDRALGELALSSLENLLALGVPKGITGPLSRGDRATVDAHLEALADPDARSLYAELADRLAALLERTRR